jgi:hypothetical protein
VNAATVAPVMRDIPSNNKPGGATTQWGVQSYGAVRFEPSKTSQSLRQGLVEQRQIADSMYVDSRFAPVEDYDYAYQPPIPEHRVPPAAADVPGTRCRRGGECRAPPWAAPTAAALVGAARQCSVGETQRTQPACAATQQHAQAAIGKTVGSFLLPAAF